MNMDFMRFEIFMMNILLLWYIATVGYFVKHEHYFLLGATSISLFFGALILLYRNYITYWEPKDIDISIIKD